MNQLITDIYSSFLQIINNENYINIISMLFVAFTSYRIARYNASKPEKLKIKQQQFSNLYLPLFRIFSTVSANLTLDEATELNQRVSKLLDQNYELAYPQLHELNSRFQSQILVEQNYQKVALAMKYQIETDYELLKKSLGYPSKSFYGIFIRMTLKQKVEAFISAFFFLSYFGMFVILPSVFLSISNFFAALLTSLGVFVLYLVLVFTLKNVIKRIRD